VFSLLSFVFNFLKERRCVRGGLYFSGSVHNCLAEFDAHVN
jgi:hypothetical protein